MVHIIKFLWKAEYDIYFFLNQLDQSAMYDVLQYIKCMKFILIVDTLFNENRSTYVWCRTYSYIYVLNMECIKCKYNAYNKIKLDRKLELSDT